MKNATRVMLLLFAALLPAVNSTGMPASRPGTHLSLGQAIAMQGNQALLQIRAEARPTLQPVDLEALAIAREPAH